MTDNRVTGESLLLKSANDDLRAAKAEIVSLRAELTANNKLYSISQSDLAAVSLQYDAATAVIERLEAAARQDAEEKARLREALILARREISDHDSDYHHRTRESTIEAIRDALACRPQGEK